MKRSDIGLKKTLWFDNLKFRPRKNRLKNKVHLHLEFVYCIFCTYSTKHKIWRILTSYLMIFRVLCCCYRNHRPYMEKPKPSLKIGSVNKVFLFWYWQQPKIFFSGTKLFCFSRQKAEIFSICLIKDFVKTYKIWLIQTNFQKTVFYWK